MEFDFMLFLNFIGMIICLFSYKDILEVSTTVKNELMTEEETRKLTELIEKEFDVLKKATK